MEKKFNTWNEKKQELHNIEKLVNFREKDIFFVSLGENIGFEQNGKGQEFQRPVLVIKRYTNDMFLGVPLSTTLRDGSFYFKFSFLEDKKSTALLVQHKLYSSKRLIKKIGMINKTDFRNLQVKLHKLIFDEDFCSSKKSDPEGNCNNIIPNSSEYVK